MIVHDKKNERRNEKSTFTGGNGEIFILVSNNFDLFNEICEFIQLPMRSTTRSHYRSGCIQTPAGICCYRRGQKYPPMPVCAEEIKLLNMSIVQYGVKVEV